MIYPGIHDTIEILILLDSCNGDYLHERKFYDF